MGKGKTAAKIHEEIVLYIARRDGLAELESIETMEDGQPGGEIRRWLRYLIEARAKFPHEVPITHITNEREGD